MKARPAKPNKRKNPNPPPVGVITYREYLEMMKGRFVPKGWEK